MHRVRSWFVGVCVLGLAGCSDKNADASSDTGRLTLTGSSTLAPLVAEIGKRFEQLHPGTRIDVQTGGSSRGIRDTRRGANDIGMSSRVLTSNEMAGLKTATIAWDGVAFVVHEDNSVAELSKEELVAIYAGNTVNWKQLGGPDAPIIVSSRAAGRSELDLMTTYLGLDPTAVAADVVDGETQQAIKTVTSNPNALVYTSIGAAQHAIKNGAPLRLLPLGGVAAATAAVKSGGFPLARPLVLIQRTGEPTRLADEFVRYARSAAVDDLIRGLGYVPIDRNAN